MDDQKPKESSINNEQSPEESAAARMYQDASGDVGVGPQLSEQPKNFRTKKTIMTVIIAVLALPFLMVLFFVVSTIIGGKVASNEYDAKKQACGHDPIAIYPAGFGNTGTHSIELGRAFPAGNDKYYCTLTEARNDGWGKAFLDGAPEDAKRLYP